MEPTHTTEALNRVEARLTQLQAQVAEMHTAYTDPHYIIGWMESAIKTALTEIEVWK